MGLWARKLGQLSGAEFQRTPFGPGQEILNVGTEWGIRQLTEARSTFRGYVGYLAF